MSDRFPVFAALPTLGFEACAAGGLEFNHGSCQLGAVHVCAPFHVVSFVGQFSVGSREFGLLEFDLPANVESLEQLKAFLAYYLRHAICAPAPGWIIEGMALSHLLPWEKDRAAYEARDRCGVRREWLRLALNDLAQALNEVTPSSQVVFSFDGSLLAMDCGRRIIVQAEGTAWRDAYTLEAGALASLPKRLVRDPMEVAIWKDQLVIGNRCYPLATTKACADSTAAHTDGVHIRLERADQAIRLSTHAWGEMLLFLSKCGLQLSTPTHWLLANGHVVGDEDAASLAAAGNIVLEETLKSPFDACRAITFDMGTFAQIVNFAADGAFTIRNSGSE